MPGRVPEPTDVNYFRDDLLPLQHEQQNNKHLNLVTGYRHLGPASFKDITGVWTKSNQFLSVPLNPNNTASLVGDWPALSAYATPPGTRRITGILAWANLSRIEATSRLEVYLSAIHGTPADPTTDTLLASLAPAVANNWEQIAASFDFSLAPNYNQFIYVLATVDLAGNATTFRVGPMRLQIE